MKIYIFIIGCLINLFINNYLFSEERFVYNNKGKRDPFLPLVTETGQILELEPKETTSLNLEGIIFDEKGKSLAVINGVVLEKGEAFDNYLVFEIKEDEVILIRGSEKSVLQLHRE